MKKYVVLIFYGFLTFISCKKDFKVIDQWKDITVVYGILNPKDPYQYIRIERAFLGEQSAESMAQISDSLYYPDGEIKVWLDEYEDNNTPTNRSFQLVTDTGNVKSSGYFAATGHKLFKTQSVLDTLNPGKKYSLIIKNQKSGKTVTSITAMVDKFSISKPSAGKKFSLYNQGNFTKEIVEWKTAKDGRLYQTILTFYYREDTDNDGSCNDEAVKGLEWIIEAQFSTDLSGGELKTTEIGGEEFYQFIASQIKPDNMKRKFESLTLTINAYGDDVATAYAINQPSLGINQEKPDYSNIKNDKGEDEVGLLSSRYSTSSTHLLTDFSIEWLVGGDQTKGLNFCDPNAGACN